MQANAMNMNISPQLNMANMNMAAMMQQQRMGVNAGLMSPGPATGSQVRLLPYWSNTCTGSLLDCSIMVVRAMTIVFDKKYQFLVVLLHNLSQYML